MGIKKVWTSMESTEVDFRTQKFERTWLNMGYKY